MICERVFLRHVIFKNGFELWPCRREFWEFKPALFLEADKENPFAVLRHDALGINHLIINCVAERFGQRVVNDLERAALVVAAEILHVFQHERGRLVNIDNVRQREEQVALFLVLETVLFAEAQFLGNARDAERLAGKTGTKNVVLRDLINRHRMDVAVRFLAKISRVGFLRFLIPIRGENAFTTGFFKREAETADAAKQINETKFVV